MINIKYIVVEFSEKGNSDTWEQCFRAVRKPTIIEASNFIHENVHSAYEVEEDTAINSYGEEVNRSYVFGITKEEIFEKIELAKQSIKIIADKMDTIKITIDIPQKVNEIKQLLSMLVM